MEIVFVEQDIPKVAKKIVQHLKHPVCMLKGEMGTGKTTLIKAICKEMGVAQNMSSPTYPIVNEYLTNKQNIIYHFDLYRIKVMEELLDIGFEEYIDSGNFCFIEWPNIALPLLPKDYHIIQLTLSENGKRILNFE